MAFVSDPYMCYTMRKSVRYNEYNRVYSRINKWRACIKPTEYRALITRASSPRSAAFPAHARHVRAKGSKRIISGQMDVDGFSKMYKYAFATEREKRTEQRSSRDRPTDRPTSSSIQYRVRGVRTLII